MSLWVILSWVFVLVLTAVNVVVFLKLKQASEQMLKMAFPGAKDMNEAMSQMQKMMGGLGGMGAMGGMGGMGGRGGFPGGGLPGGGLPGGGKTKGGKGSDAQLKAAMDMLAQMQKKQGKR